MEIGSGNTRDWAGRGFGLTACLLFRDSILYVFMALIHFWRANRDRRKRDSLDAEGFRGEYGAGCHSARRKHRGAGCPTRVASSVLRFAVCVSRMGVTLKRAPKKVLAPNERNEPNERITCKNQEIFSLGRPLHAFLNGDRSR
jgi:hypothetical protein